MSDWIDLPTRHTDGRTGHIVEEFIGFGYRSLKILAKDGSTAVVQLNVNGPDSGEAGWSWCYVGPTGRETWYPLGRFPEAEPSPGP